MEGLPATTRPGESGSLASEGGGVMSIALVLVMIIALLGSWGALWLVNRLKARQ